MGAEPPALLVLAGSAEARAVLEALGGEAAAGRLRIVASLAGATRAPRALPVETRVGGFGGADGLAAFLEERRIGAVLDATHPFAARISANAAAACAAQGVARAQLRRPGWEGPARRFPDLASALAAAPAGARVLAATGRGSAPLLAGRGDLSILVRVAEAGDEIAGVETLVARPPHDAEAERALMRGRGITHLLARDSGGIDGAKFAVARELGVEILLAERPPAQPGPVLPDVQAALGWVRETLGLGG
ncbi:precorrin-6A/cobalt-precorrin-6A reductase [Albimonas sp. CAU 1670]|uniref:precorrin-6A/cobalt-precorrin-6A reductase n=1 Tax=Albimonas sp. CAU 1670 TaxID=3032599 RepID=UPI0023DA0A54|nr:precorrin-6A/cobalt-precorrin-6A reductase [Albimonas sp. CAU 1670]MDF2233884.1 precorrin-6A/cobalt-precorrin-6A reductase [Albimonas sp. CAU 1670]